MPCADQEGGTENQYSAERRRAGQSKANTHCSYTGPLYRDEVTGAQAHDERTQPTGGPTAGRNIAAGFGPLETQQSCHSPSRGLRSSSRRRCGKHYEKQGYLEKSIRWSEAFCGRNCLWQTGCTACKWQTQTRAHCATERRTTSTAQKDAPTWTDQSRCSVVYTGRSKLDHPELSLQWGRVSSCGQRWQPYGGSDARSAMAGQNPHSLRRPLRRSGWQNWATGVEGSQ